MITYQEVLTESKKDYSSLGGAIGKTSSLVISPIPGTAPIISPLTSAVGEVIGKMIPRGKTNSDSLINKIEKNYDLTKKENLSFSPEDHIKAAKKRVKSAGDKSDIVVKTTIATDPLLGTLVKEIKTKKGN